MPSKRKKALRSTRKSSTTVKSAKRTKPAPLARKTAPPKSRSKAKDIGKTANGIADYRHDEATRKNNPPAKIAAEVTVPILPKIKYEHSPRLAPVLRFDPDGTPDSLPGLLQNAQKRVITSEEAHLLASALRNQQPWLSW